MTLTFEGKTIDLNKYEDDGGHRKSNACTTRHPHHNFKSVGWNLQLFAGFWQYRGFYQTSLVWRSMLEQQRAWMIIFLYSGTHQMFSKLEIKFKQPIKNGIHSHKPHRLKITASEPDRITYPPPQKKLATSWRSTLLRIEWQLQKDVHKCLQCSHIMSWITAPIQHSAA